VHSSSFCYVQNIKTQLCKFPHWRLPEGWGGMKNENEIGNEYAYVIRSFGLMDICGGENL